MYKEKISLSEKITKVLVQTKINDMPEDYDHIYILGKNNEHKVILLRVNFVLNESNLKVEISQSAEVQDLSRENDYSIVHQINKVVIVGNGKIILVNGLKLEEQHKIDSEDLSHSNIIKTLNETEIEQVIEEKKEDIKDASKSEDKIEKLKHEGPQKQGIF